MRGRVVGVEREMALYRWMKREVDSEGLVQRNGRRLLQRNGERERDGRREVATERWIVRDWYKEMEEDCYREMEREKWHGGLRG